jgi:nicotinamidase/pyrazinamidase
MEKRAVIAVDVQEDFLPNGALGVSNGHHVVFPLITLMKDKGTDVIVFTQDWHPENHVSFSSDPEYKDGSWPPHCVQNTQGAELDSMLLDAARATGKPILFVRKGVLPEAEAYSGFNGRVVEQENTDLDLKGEVLYTALAKLDVAMVIIGGLALDYCVRSTALDAAIDFDTYVSLDATMPVAMHSGLEAVADLCRHGVDFW